MAVTAATVALGAAFTAGTASAARRATHAERRAIVRASRRACSAQLSIVSARISTADPRYAVAVVNIEEPCLLSAVFLRRPGRHSTHWRPILKQGTNPLTCRDYRRKLPERVVRDFRVSGFRGQRLGAC